MPSGYVFWEDKDGVAQRNKRITLLQQLILCALSGASASKADDKSESVPVLALEDLSTCELVLGEEINGSYYFLLRYPCLDPTGEAKASTPGEISGEADDIHRLLSPREEEIMRMIAKGYPNKTIAAILDISPWTVGTHVRRIFSKLNVSSRAAMIARIANLKN